MGSIPDGHWCRIGYASGVLIAVFVISIIGAKAFGKASILLLTVVTCLIGVLFVSFVGDFTHTEEFTETTLANCTTNCSYTSYNGSFYGLAYEAGSHIEVSVKSYFISQFVFTTFLLHRNYGANMREWQRSKGTAPIEMPERVLSRFSGCCLPG